MDLLHEKPLWLSTFTKHLQTLVTVNLSTINVTYRAVTSWLFPPTRIHAYCVLWALSTESPRISTSGDCDVRKLQAVAYYIAPGKIFYHCERLANLFDRDSPTSKWGLEKEICLLAGWFWFDSISRPHKHLVCGIESHCLSGKSNPSFQGFPPDGRYAWSKDKPARFWIPYSTP